jgi:hypothetical protein
MGSTQQIFQLGGELANSVADTDGSVHIAPVATYSDTEMVLLQNSGRNDIAKLRIVADAGQNASFGSFVVNLPIQGGVFGANVDEEGAL